MSDEVESPPEATTKPAPKTRPFLFPSRIVLFALLAVAVIGLIVDQMARKSAQAAFQAIDDKMGEEKKLNEVTPADVRQILGREPDEDSDPEDVYEQYSWQGAIFPQRVYVHYRSGKRMLLKDVSLNNPPPGFPD